MKKVFKLATSTLAAVIFSTAALAHAASSGKVTHPVEDFSTAALAHAASSGKVTHPVEEGFVDLTNGMSLQYYAQGEAGVKPLLLFIHGAPERAEVWLDYMDFLSEDFFTVAYTTRGYHPSSIPTYVEAYNINTLADDAVAIAESFGYSTFSMVGHDWGASTAWRVALNHPNSVEKLVALSSPHPLIYARAYHETAEHRAAVDSYIPLVRNNIAPWTRVDTLANHVEHFKYNVYTPQETEAISWSMGLKLEQTWVHNDGESLDSIYNHYKALDFPFTTLNTCNPAPNFSLTVHQPVLNIYGDNDTFTAKEAYTLPNNDCTPNTKYVELKDAGHFINHSHKQLLKYKIKYFLK